MNHMRIGLLRPLRPLKICLHVLMQILPPSKSENSFEKLRQLSKRPNLLRGVVLKPRRDATRTEARHLWRVRLSASYRSSSTLLELHTVRERSLGRPNPILGSEQASRLARVFKFLNSVLPVKAILLVTESPTLC